MAVIALQLCPFLIILYEGGEPLAHSQMAYSVAIAGTVVFLAGLPKGNKNFPQIAVAVASVVLVWNQTKVVMRLIYTDNVRVEEDRHTVMEIAGRVHEASVEEKPVVFIGYYTNKLNPACIREGEYNAITMLGWDHNGGIHYLDGSRRTIQFFNTLSYGLESVSDEETVLRARRAAMDMPVWPAPGSVADNGDCIIVKLCEDEWPEEVLDPVAVETHFNHVAVNSKVSVNIDGIEKDDGKLIVKGTVNQENDKYVSWTPQLYIVADGKAYGVSTAKTHRVGLGFDGVDCPDSAFLAVAPWDGVLDSAEEYRFLFTYTDNISGETGVILPSVNADAGEGLIPNGGLPEEGMKEKTVKAGYGGFYYANAVIDSEFALTSTGDAEGCILWGPYTESVPGTYDITLNYEIESVPEGAEAIFDIALDEEQIVSTPLATGQHSVTLQDVGIEGGHRFEARLWVPVGMIIRMESIQYERIGE